jgi:hypothetical protein
MLWACSSRDEVCAAGRQLFFHGSAALLANFSSSCRAYMDRLYKASLTYPSGGLPT